MPIIFEVRTHSATKDHSRTTDLYYPLIKEDPNGQNYLRKTLFLAARNVLAAVPPAMMPAVKRQASDSFSSSSQVVVKRQKSSSNLNNNSAVAVVGGEQNGALVQSVCLHARLYERSTDS
jgi:hypothetical protein